MRERIISLFLGVSSLLILLALLVVHSDSSISATVVSEGHITTDTVWNASGSPYFVEGNVTVDYGVSLTIEAGVEVRFNGYYGLYIGGNLSAQGNITNMIRFTSNGGFPAVEDWYGIQISSTGRADLEYCNITYASRGISVSGSSGNDIQSSHISHNLDGIYLFESVNNTVIKNNISNNTNNGIFLGGSSGNIIRSNDISDNFWHGIHLYDDSMENDIRSNRITGNFRGIFLRYSDSNMIRYNHISENFGDGVQVRDSSDTEIGNNNISDNGDSGIYYGIDLNLSYSNRVFHNTLIGNANQAHDDTINGNQWDNGYPSGGNYWSDYTGEDVKRGENQDIPGPDGIGDTNYTLDSDSADEFPLMEPSRNIAPYLIALISPPNESIIKQDSIIDLDVLAQDFDTINYSVNGGTNISLNHPFNISTSTWDEGGNRLDVHVIDINGNVNSTWFFFILDPIKPEIRLNSPLNDSIIRAGEILDISISDTNMKSSEYHVNGDQRELLFPYDIDTSSWLDEIYSITIHAEDLAGNTNSTVFVFTLDSTPPKITLNFPANNSYIKPGTVINFSISDGHLDTSSINYSVNGLGPYTFWMPYNMTTAGWVDGNYEIEVNATDILGNAQTNLFNITIDSVPPVCVLNEPMNNSEIKSGTPLNFFAFDANPFTFAYSLDMEGSFTVPPPYNINTSAWSDGLHIINVTITDYAGNIDRSWYRIITDSSKPIIKLEFPSDNLFIRAGFNIIFDIFDMNLIFANYSVNGGEYQSLMPSLEINTTGWTEGIYDIEVYAGDFVGNNISASFTINIDSSPPRVVFTSPRNRASEVSLNTSITIKFNEAMDKGSIWDAINITPSIYFTHSWSSDNLSLVITPLERLTNDTVYTIVINTTAHDLAGNTLKKDFVLRFSTGRQPEDRTWLIIMAILVIIIIIILIGLLISRRQKGKKDVAGAGGEDEFDLAGEEVLNKEELEAELERGEHGEELSEKETRANRDIED